MASKRIAIVFNHPVIVRIDDVFDRTKSIKVYDRAYDDTLDPIGYYSYHKAITEVLKEIVNANKEDMIYGIYVDFDTLNRGSYTEEIAKKELECILTMREYERYRKLTHFNTAFLSISSCNNYEQLKNIIQALTQ